MVWVSKLNVAQVQDSIHEVPNFVILFFGEANFWHALVNLFEIAQVIDIWSQVAVWLLEICISRAFLAAILFRCTKSIKSMKCSFLARNRNHSRFLQQVADNICAFDRIFIWKKYLDVLPKPTRVVISYSLAISKSFQQGVASQNLFFDGVTFFMTQASQDLHAILGWFCFPSSTFSWNDNGLLGIWLTHGHEVICFSGNGINMWGQVF